MLTFAIKSKCVWTNSRQDENFRLQEPLIISILNLSLAASLVPGKLM